MNKIALILCWLMIFVSPAISTLQDPFNPESDADLDNKALSTKENTNSAIIKTISLKHSDAIQLVNKLSGIFGNGVLAADPRTNKLIVHSSPSILYKIQNILKELDKPMPQIMIEARIVTMNDLSLKELGVRWGVFDKLDTNPHFSGTNASFPATQSNINLPVPNPSIKLALQLGSINGRLLDLELSALEKENSVTIIARPKLLTTYKHTAKIQQGTELPYVINGKDDTQNIEFKDALLSLEVTPQITEGNQILLDLKITQNTPGEQSQVGKNEFVAIEKQEIETQVLAQNGETIVLGGILHDTVGDFVDKVPLLGDIPLIKHLFRHKGERHQKRELIIFVTPKIVDNNYKPREIVDINSNNSSIFRQNFPLDIN